MGLLQQNPALLISVTVALIAGVFGLVGALFNMRSSANLEAQKSKADQVITFYDTLRQHVMAADARIDALTTKAEKMQLDILDCLAQRNGLLVKLEASRLEIARIERKADDIQAALDAQTVAQTVAQTALIAAHTAAETAQLAAETVRAAAIIAAKIASDTAERAAAAAATNADPSHPDSPGGAQ